MNNQSINHSNNQSTHEPIKQIDRSICLSVCLSLCLSLNLSGCLSIFQYILLFSAIYGTVYLSYPTPPYPTPILSYPNPILSYPYIYLNASLITYQTSSHISFAAPSRISAHEARLKAKSEVLLWPGFEKQLALATQNMPPEKTLDISRSSEQNMVKNM